MDLKTVFLQGKSIERDVFIKPPKEANTNELWKLKTTVYGLFDEPGTWYLSVKKELQQDVLRVDMMMQYFIAIKKTPYKVFYLHMSMTCWTGTKLFKNTVISHIRNAFTASKEKLQTFKYLGLNISQTNHGIFMHQKEYIEEIDKHNQKDTSVPRELLPHETQQLRRVATQLN